MIRLLKGNECNYLDSFFSHQKKILTIQKLISKMIKLNISLDSTFKRIQGLPIPYTSPILEREFICVCPDCDLYLSKLQIVFAQFSVVKLQHATKSFFPVTVVVCCLQLYLSRFQIAFF